MKYKNLKTITIIISYTKYQTQLASSHHSIFFVYTWSCCKQTKWPDNISNQQCHFINQNKKFIILNQQRALPC